MKNECPMDIMIIEDDELTTEIYCEYIRELGNFNVSYSAKTGEQALKILKKHKPQLILLDIFLPDIHGVDLLWRIRENFRGIDIILITAASDAETVGEAIRGGAFSYIIKPVTMKRLFATLQKYEAVAKQLDQRSLLKQLEVDSFFQSPDQSPTLQKKTLPKGIDRFTLQRVKDKIASISGSVGTHQFANQIGVSHSTARRYLEYLVSEYLVEVTIHHGTVGRPERKYQYRGGKPL